jgi:light-regulated signal transduction histidine kinase (bacteriophytochrome)
VRQYCFNVPTSMRDSLAITTKVAAALVAGILSVSLEKALVTDNAPTQLLSILIIAAGLLVFQKLFSPRLPQQNPTDTQTIRAQSDLQIEMLRRDNATIAAQVKKTESEMEQFMYIASHDLQEPLRMISSYSALINNSFQHILPEDGLRWLNYVSSAATKMQRRILDLLAYSRIISVDDTPSKIDTNKIVADVIELLQPQIAEKKAVIKVADLPEITGHRALISSLMQNLIGNALKFTREDVSPEINIKCEQFEEFMKFCIQDNGIGIRADSFDKVFVLFQRLHGENDYPGTGVGLAVCKRIVEKHGGHLAVTSIVGIGSTFSFTLPTELEGTNRLSQALGAGGLN